MPHRRSLLWTITIAVIMIVLLVLMLVGWILLAGAAGYWTVLAIGTMFLVLLLVGVIYYLVLSIQEIRLNQRQANFIDSVTHELKSPLASLKLYVQTLERRRMTDENQADFFRLMLDDVERLDRLINHMLDAARVDQAPVDGEVSDVELSHVLQRCAEAACQRYRLPKETVRLQVQPAVVRGRLIDVEMVFYNLIDNAMKYAGDPPAVEVECWANAKGRIVARIADNGRGIPLALRRKIFGRFVRLGSELEREKPGTGLGLYIVRTLVRRMRGSITVRGRPNQTGTIFEVELPGQCLPIASLPESSRLEQRPAPASHPGNGPSPPTPPENTPKTG